MTTSKPRPAEAAASTRAGETQCCADAKAGKGSPISSTSEPHPAHNWRLTAVTECNWIYDPRQSGRRGFGDGDVPVTRR